MSNLKEEIIEALEIVYDWIDYTQEYFIEKYNWKRDDKLIQEIIKRVEEATIVEDQ